MQFNKLLYDIKRMIATTLRESVLINLSEQLVIANLEELNPLMIETKNGEEKGITFADVQGTMIALDKLLSSKEAVYKEHFNANLAMIEFLSLMLQSQIEYSQKENSILMQDTDYSRTIREKLGNINRHLLVLLTEYRQDDQRKMTVDMMRTQFFLAIKSDPALNGFINALMSWNHKDALYVLSDFDKIVINPKNQKPILYSSKHKVSFTMRCDKHGIRVGSQIKHVGIKRTDNVLTGEQRTRFLEELELKHKPK